MDSFKEPRTDTMSNYSDKRDTFARITPNGIQTGMKPEDSPQFSTPDLRSRRRHDEETDSLLGKTTRV